MSTQHTPGPWVTGNTDPLLFGRKQGHGTEPIGFIYGPACPELSEVGQQALANARLIAAAPDLLELLREAADCTRHPDYDWPVEFSHRVDAAIAKATGGAK